MHEEEWDDLAAGWDDAPGTREYADGAFRSLLDALDARGIPLAGAALLDFGCGTGLLTEHLVGGAASIDAFDTSPAMRRVLSAKVAAGGWRNVRVCDHLLSPGERYDLIVCSSVLAFVEDYRGSIDRLSRLLRPGGLLVQWDWERDEEDPEGGGLDADEIRAALTIAGLVDVDVRVGFEVAADGAVMRPLMGIGQRVVDPTG